MSKKLLFNEGGKLELVPVLNKYTGTDSNYPIEINSELLDEEEKTYIEEIKGNTWQCDVIKIYDNGSKTCSFTFNKAIDNPDTNMLEIQHASDAFIETNESFIIQNNYKIGECAKHNCYFWNMKNDIH